MRYKSNVGPHVQWRRNALGSSQPLLAKKLQIAGFDISRIGVSKIEARFLCERQNTSLFSGSARGTGAGTLFDPTAWQSNLRSHRAP